MFELGDESVHWIGFAYSSHITSTALLKNKVHWVDRRCLESSPSFALARQWHTKTSIRNPKVKLLHDCPNRSCNN
jgi:hypothetical protein